MKKTVIIAITIAVAAGIAAGGYFWLNRADNNNENTAKIEAEASKNNDYNARLEQMMEQVKAEYPSVKDTKVCNQSNDPNGVLGKPMEYIACAVFHDERTGVAISTADWGTDAGGSIEVYAQEAQAAARSEELAKFQGTALNPGAYRQSGVYVVRASSKLPIDQQEEYINFLLTQVDPK